MRPLEIVLTLANTATFVTLATTLLRRSGWRRRAAFLAPAIAAAQALLEGPRWQLIPAYVLSVLFLAIGLLPGLPLGLELDAAVGRDRDLLAWLAESNSHRARARTRWVLSCSAWVHLRILKETPYETDSFRAGCSYSVGRRGRLHGARIWTGQ